MTPHEYLQLDNMPFTRTMPSSSLRPADDSRGPNVVSPASSPMQHVEKLPDKKIPPHLIVYGDIVLLRKLWPYMVQHITIRGWDILTLGQCKDVNPTTPSPQDDASTPTTRAEAAHALLESICDHWLQKAIHPDAPPSLRGSEQLGTVHDDMDVLNRIMPVSQTTRSHFHGLHFLGTMRRLHDTHHEDIHDTARMGLAICLSDVSSGAGFSAYQSNGPTHVTKRNDVQTKLCQKLDVNDVREFCRALPVDHSMLVLGARCTPSAFKELIEGHWMWEQARDESVRLRDEHAKSVNTEMDTSTPLPPHDPIRVAPTQTDRRGGTPNKVIHVIDQSLMEFDWFGNYSNPLHYVQQPEHVHGFLGQHGFSEHSMPRFTPQCTMRRMHSMKRGDTMAIQHVAPTVSPASRMYHGADSQYPPSTHVVSVDAHTASI